jgi:hypothetical protein
MSTSTFSKAETYEFLSKYPQETIPSVLKQLGYDEDTIEYPADIVERAEKIYESMGLAVETQKQLAESMGQVSQNTKLVVQQTTAIAGELLEQQGISFPPDVVMVLAQAAVEEGSQLAQDLATLKEAALVAGLRSSNDSLAQKLLYVMGSSRGIIQEVFTTENVQAMVSNTVPEVAPPDVKGFLNDLDTRRQQRKQLEGAKQEKRAALPRATVDVKAFLAARP